MRKFLFISVLGGLLWATSTAQAEVKCDVYPGTMCMGEMVEGGSVKINTLSGTMCPAHRFSPRTVDDLVSIKVYVELPSYPYYSGVKVCSMRYIYWYDAACTEKYVSVSGRTVLTFNSTDLSPIKGMPWQETVILKIIPFSGWIDMKIHQLEICWNVQERS